MPDALEVRRGPTRRETTVYVVATLGALGMFLLARSVERMSAGRFRLAPLT
jgi:hypothetical protein